MRFLLISLIVIVSVASGCSREAKPELVCLSRVIRAVFDADKNSNPDTVDGATAIAKAEVAALKTVSTTGCTAQQREDVGIMAKERQIVVSLGERLQAIRAGKLKPVSEKEELKRADEMMAATASFQKRMDQLFARMQALSQENHS